MPNPCNVCGNTSYEERTITHVFTTPIGEKVVIDHIPVTECMHCGEKNLSAETTEHIMSIVAAAANKSLAAVGEMPVYEYA